MSLSVGTYFSYISFSTPEKSTNNSISDKTSASIDKSHSGSKSSPFPNVINVQNMFSARFFFDDYNSDNFFFSPSSGLMQPNKHISKESDPVTFSSPLVNEDVNSIKNKNQLTHFIKRIKNIFNKKNSLSPHATNNKELDNQRWISPKAQCGVIQTSSPRTTARTEVSSSVRESIHTGLFKPLQK